MTSLLDITPKARTVVTSMGEITVPGLSMTALVHVLKKHPEVLALMQGKSAQDLTYDKLLDLGVDVCASLLAAGLGYPGNDQAVERCKALKPQDAFDLGKAVLEESFPQGAQSFLVKVTEAMNGVVKIAEQNLPKTSSSNSLKAVSG